MGIFKKKKIDIQEEPVTGEPIEIAESSPEEDEFTAVTKPARILRKDFHKTAKIKLSQAIESGEITPKDPNAKEATPEDVSDSDDTPKENKAENAYEETPEEAKKERTPIGVIIKEFLARHKKGFTATWISLASIFVIILGIYVYGCYTLTPDNVMGRNIYIEGIDVSGLTYNEALEKAKATPLLKNRDLTLVSHGKTFIIDGVEAGLAAKIEDTVDRAMRYGKTGNVLIDGFANTLQYFFPHTVLPSASVKEDVIKSKLYEFGEIIHGKLVEHSFEFGDGFVICTPGHTGFSRSIDRAYAEVIEAINNENFSSIRVTLSSAPPKPCTYEMIKDFTHSEPKNAHYQIINGEAAVVKEVPGKYLNHKEASTLCNLIFENGEKVYIPYYETDAQVKEEDLKAKLFNATLGSYQTAYYAGGNRGMNIAIASGKINNKVLLPGEVFSFNDTVGPRSSANGFLPAEEYSNGQTVMGIGGGTCQVTTTLYNAVLYSDLSIVSKLNHMFAVGYAPLGQDATVSDSGVDFKFANNTDHPIKIESVTGGGQITITIIGTARDVEHKVKIENITRPVGADRSVRSYRYVYDPDGNLIRKDDLGKSYYLAHP